MYNHHYAFINKTRGGELLLINYKNQIPTDELFMSLIKVDRLYGHLQSLSDWNYKEGGFRYVLKENYSPTKIAKKLGCTRTTVYNQMEKLLKNNFVELQEDRYILKYNKSKYTTVAPELLEFFSHISAKDEVLALYSYFRAMYSFHKDRGNEAFYFTRTFIIEKVWGKTNGSANYKKLDSILYTLAQLGLIDIQIKKSQNELYDIYYITNVFDFISTSFMETNGIPGAIELK